MMAAVSAANQGRGMSERNKLGKKIYLTGKVDVT